MLQLIATFIVTARSLIKYKKYTIKGTSEGTQEDNGYVSYGSNSPEQARTLFLLPNKVHSSKNCNFLSKDF
jgi:hypothetical protein